MKLFLPTLFLLSNSITPSLANSVNVVNNQKSNLDLKEYNLGSLTKDVKEMTKKKIKLHLHKDVAYVSVKEFLDSIAPIIKHDLVKHEYKNNKATVTLNSKTPNLKVEFDYKTQDIIVSDNSIFMELLKDKERGEEKLKLEFQDIKNENPIKEFKFHLRDYGIEMLKDDDIYLPIVLLNQIFLSDSNIQLYFNQEEVNIFRFAETLTNFINTVNLKGTKISERNIIPKDLRIFQYKYLGFLFDHYYGIKLKNNKFYKDYFKNYEKWILSDSTDKHYLATKQLIADLDDPHSAFVLDGYFNKGEEYKRTPIESKSKENRYKKWNDTLHLLANHDPNKIEYQNMYLSDNKTSVISFKKFEETSAQHIEKSLKQAQEKGIENIIFNVTQNGGGFIGAAYEIMGFLTDKPFKVYNYNPLSKEQKVETIKSKYNKFNFNYYILTSPYSFSAGNIFPQIAKDNKVAKLIGYKTFGGASSIGYFILPTGDIIQLSTNNVFTSSKFRSLEFGVKPDVMLEGNVETNAKDLYEYNKLIDLIKKADKIPFGNDPDSTIIPSPTLPIKPDDKPNYSIKPQPILSKLIKNKNLKISKNDPTTLLIKLFEDNPDINFDQELRISLKDPNKAIIYLENNPEDKITINFSVVKEMNNKLNKTNQTRLILILVSSSLLAIIVLVSAIIIIKKYKNKK
ncbi:peptidase S41 [Mycoplasma feriruminatoris]|uniref:S41 family peptidase n=1 Tax=Mycoplasma feriruminatoris TaxID=1179777 RepID=UPI00241E5F9B|nr:S41 family peptidase [Mycoplasma feriruminatoris]WFQ96133.1 peptidase S41 [Mycoplasma feriruminatoris]